MKLVKRAGRYYYSVVEIYDLNGFLLKLLYSYSNDITRHHITLNGRRIFAVMCNRSPFDVAYVVPAYEVPLLNSLRSDPVVPYNTIYTTINFPAPNRAY